MDHLRITTANFQCRTAVNAARDDARATETDCFENQMGQIEGASGHGERRNGMKLVKTD